MNDRNYKIFLQGLLMTIYLIVAYAILYVLIFCSIRLFKLPEYFESFVYPIISISYIPLLIYVRNNYGINVFKEIRLPEMQLFMILVFIAISMYFVSIPLFNPLEFIKIFSIGEIKLVNFKTITFNVDFIFYQILYGVIIAPVVEEMLFRGIILRQFLKKYTTTVALILSSLLFTLVHLRLADAGSIFFHGLIFGTVYYKTNSLGASIFLHSFSNLICQFLILKATSLTDPRLINTFVIFSFSCISLYCFMRFLDKPVRKNLL